MVHRKRGVSSAFLVEARLLERRMKNYQPHHTVVLRGLDGIRSVASSGMEHITYQTFRKNQKRRSQMTFYIGVDLHIGNDGFSRKGPVQKEMGSPNYFKFTREFKSAKI